MYNNVPGLDDDPTLLLEAEHIVKTYVKPGSEYEINISSTQMHRCLKVRLSIVPYMYVYMCVHVCLCMYISNINIYM